MQRYNLLIAPNANIENIVLELQQLGAQNIVVFSALNVINLAFSETHDFTTISGVVTQDEDHDVTPEISASWQQLRVCSPNLPMLDTYRTKNLGEGSVVYLVDTGVKTDIPELSDRDIVQFYSHDESFEDTNGHGTALASIIVGNTIGISPNAKINVVKIPTGTNVPVSELLKAFDAILTNHRLTPGVKVVNCSWVITKSSILDTKLTELHNEGLVIVAAAGNQGVAADLYSPVGLDAVLGVAASDVYDRVISWGNGSSNWGPEVDITAPGIDVAISLLTGELGEGSGTSFAAAVTSGVVCQYITQFTELSSVEILDNVKEKARENMLFRNESIYGTTPNRLLQTVYRLGYFLSPEIRTFNMKAGTEISLPITFEEPVVSVTNENIVENGNTILMPDWATLDAEQNVIHISPTLSDVSPHKYRLYMRGLDVNGNQIGGLMLRVGVYENVESELDTYQKEQYSQVTPSGNVQVILQGYCNSCAESFCDKGSYCAFCTDCNCFTCIFTSSGTCLDC